MLGAQGLVRWDNSEGISLQNEIIYDYRRVWKHDNATYILNTTQGRSATYRTARTRQQRRTDDTVHALPST
jgi:hypothetical protein